MKPLHPALERLIRWPRKKPAGRFPIHLKMTRAQLPRLCRELGFREGAEIGVWKGAYSAAFCEQLVGMLCVDPWENYPAWKDTKNMLPADEAAALMANAYLEAQARLQPLNCRIVRAFSVEAAATVPDRSLDVVYIDANHVQEAVQADLEAWAPKVRPGGIVAGHDFRHFKNKPTIQVIPAVQAFTAKHKIRPWFVTSLDKTPSFLWVQT